jgi:hypothetical protein
MGTSDEAGADIRYCGLGFLVELLLIPDRTDYTAIWM